MTPAEELRTAATTLRETAAKAHPAPWRPEIDELGRGVDVRDGRDTHIAFGLTMADSAWTAIAHPGLAEPLAAWLESVAADMESHNAVEGSASKAVHPVHFMFGPSAPREDWTAALAVARVINGGTA